MLFLKIFGLFVLDETEMLGLTEAVLPRQAGQKSEYLITFHVDQKYPASSFLSRAGFCKMHFNCNYCTS